MYKGELSFRSILKSMMLLLIAVPLLMADLVMVLRLQCNCNDKLGIITAA
jgi:hypothetical protein